MSALFFHLRHPYLRSSSEVWAINETIDGPQWCASYIKDGGGTFSWKTVPLHGGKHFLNYTEMPVEISEVETETTCHGYRVSYLRTLILSERMMKVDDFLSGRIASVEYPSSIPSQRSSIVLYGGNGIPKYSQGEYPCGMTKPGGSLVCFIPRSPISAHVVSVVLVNIVRDPSPKLFRVDLVERLSSSCAHIDTYYMKSNSYTVVEYPASVFRDKALMLLSTGVRAIPYFIWHFADGDVAFEHTHSPDHFVTGKRGDFLSRLKQYWMSR